MPNANEPAYPRQDERCPTTGHGIREGSSGLTKRELAAFMAMQGIMANVEYMKALDTVADQDGLTAECAISVASVEIADALLRELEKT